MVSEQRSRWRQRSIRRQWWHHLGGRCCIRLSRNNTCGHPTILKQQLLFITYLFNFRDLHGSGGCIEQVTLFIQSVSHMVKIKYFKKNMRKGILSLGCFSIFPCPYCDLYLFHTRAHFAIHDGYGFELQIRRGFATLSCIVRISSVF